MLTWIDYCNSIIAISGITIGILGALVSINIQFMDKWTRDFFVTMFILHILYLSSNFVSQLSMYFLDGRYRLVTLFALFFESLFNSRT